MANDPQVADPDSAGAAPCAAETDEARRKGLAYLYGRQSDNGGFCFYKSEYLDEPNLGDTYHAVAALTLLHSDVPRVDALLRFLDEASLYGPGYLHAYVFTLDLLGQPDRIDPSRLALLDRWPLTPPQAYSGEESFDGWLRNLLCLLRLKRRFARLEPLPDLVEYVECHQSGGGYGSKPNLIDTALCLNVLALLTVRPPSPDTRAFVDSLQVPIFGFTATRDSLCGYLDVVHAGVQCCRLLGLPIRYRTELRQFVLACQTDTGGFSRAPVALQDIELTRYGLGILQALDEESDHGR